VKQVPPVRKTGFELLELQRWREGKKWKIKKSKASEKMFYKSSKMEGEKREK
jgi:hypothetical protein